jgi:plasmid stabilization system protein ParE
MPRGDKSKYTDKQKRKADHIAVGYERGGLSEKEAERRAWATVNKDDGGGKRPGGSGYGKLTRHPTATRAAFARKAAATRRRNAENDASP